MCRGVVTAAVVCWLGSEGVVIGSFCDEKRGGGSVPKGVVVVVEEFGLDVAMST